MALGRSMAPVYATDDDLCDALVGAGQTTGELLWPFPLVEDYRPQLDSQVADINHIAGTGGGGGSISAALFLREFVGSRRWAHLDIAGVGRSDVDRGLLTKGGTGFGARLLRPVFARPAAWRALDATIAVVMAALAVSLAVRGLTG